MLLKPETNGPACWFAGYSLHLLLLKNMATAMTGFLDWLKNQRSDSPERWQHFHPHPQCS
jgi:hypothetical protein